MITPVSTPTWNQRPQTNLGFSRLDLLASICCLVVLGGIAFPWVARSGVTRQTVGCVENLHQLLTAWSLYAEDSGGRVVNNFSVTEMMATVSDKTYQNWAHNVLDWSINPSNTNLTHLKSSRLYPYLSDNPETFKCPNDLFTSPAQRARGWTARVRSYSMNGFMGLTGPTKSEPTRRGENRYVSGYRQFLKTTSIPNPGETLVFLDEHPDSNNDGYFLESIGVSSQWGDLPGSHHEGGAGVGFADGSAIIHPWASKSSRIPVRYGAFLSTFIPTAERGDYQWLVQRLTVKATTLGIRPTADHGLTFTWSQYPTNYVLQSSPTAESTHWNDVPNSAVRADGQSEVTLESNEDRQFYRLQAR